MRVAINGMGRIGRLLYRRLISHPGIELVAVNDIMPADNLFYLVKYDSIYGTLPVDISFENGRFRSGEKDTQVFTSSHPSKLPWKELGVDIVLECSGSFSSKAGAEEHLKAGAKKVLLSTTGSEDIPLLVYGHNHSTLTKDMHIISPGGCMTNCSVPILSLLDSIGIQTAHLNILHSYTSRQELVDAPHKHFRRGRAAAESIIPVEIDLHVSLERSLPALRNKIAAVSTRVPVGNGAMADFTVQMNQGVTVTQINELFRKAAIGEYKGILDYTEEQLVSLDIKSNTHSCIIDGTLTSVIGNHVKVIAWFDNEYGFTSRMLDLLHYWAPLL